MAEKLDKNILGTQITDELHNGVGAGFCALDHDTFFGAADMRICTAAGGGGVTLIENVDYTLHDTDAALTVECAKNVYTTYKIINPVYQACDLFFTYKTVGDYREAADANHIRDHLAITAAYTVQDSDRNPVIFADTVGGNITVTLPTAADNALKLVTVIKTSNSNTLTIDGEGAETLVVADVEFAAVELWNKGEKIELLCDGVSWWQMNPCEWHYVQDPATGFAGVMAAGWTADQFTPGGLEVDFTGAVPLGARTAGIYVFQESTKSRVFWRASGDANISNTPGATGERSHEIMYAADDGTPLDVSLSDDYKTEFAVTSINTDLSVSYPSRWLR